MGVYPKIKFFMLTKTLYICNYFIIDMKPKKSVCTKKDLNRLSSDKYLMKRNKNSVLKGEELINAIKIAQKDPEFIKEINRFIKITTS